MTLVEIHRPPLPPFTRESAIAKVRAAEDAWNSRDPARVALAYTIDSEWRNRDCFLVGRAAIVALLSEKWAREEEYPARQGSMGVQRQPNCRALPV